MAGDSYTVTAYLDTDAGASLDSTDVAPLKVDAKTPTATTGTWEIWREIDMVAYYTKPGTFVPPRWDQFHDFYRAANMKVNVIAPTVFDKDAYNAAVAKAVEILLKKDSDKYAALKYAVDTSADHASERHAVTYRSYDDFLKQLTDDLGDKAEVDSFRRERDLSTEERYLANALSCDGTKRDWGQAMATEIANQFLDNTKEGFHVFQFGNLCNLEGVKNVSSPVNAYASFMDNHTQTACAVVLAGDPDDEHTTAFGHEFGHHNFLPHSWDKDDDTPGPDPDSHDAADDHCMMAYAGVGPEDRFCGHCLIRLRGWPRLKSLAASNSSL
jgi:hypothetical protein